MANSLDTLQQKTSFSVNRDSFLDRVVKNEDLSKKDIRVLLLLLTSLPGYCDRPTRDDPKKFEAVHPKAIAKTLKMKKKDVEDCLEHLCELCIIEIGNSETIKNGYRLTF